MGTEPSLSVVVPVLNGARTIADLLAALAGQKGLPSAPEIIVVDNGSTDGTQAIIASHDDAAFPVALLSESRQGPSAARNRGLSAARGEIVAFLDADTLPTRSWLAELVKPFAGAAVTLVGGRTLDYMPTTSVERYMSQAPTARLEYSFFRQHLNYIGAGNMAVRRQAALAIGGWDEDFYTAEDFDFCIRLARQGEGTMVHQPKAVLFNRHRRTARAMIRQAWGYGQGLGQIHLRYPNVVPVSADRWIEVARVLSVRGAKAVALPLACRAGLATPAAAEYAHYHWTWSRWFWAGFLSMIRYREWRCL